MHDYSLKILIDFVPLYTTIASNTSAMDKLIIKVPGAPSSEIELKPGVNRFGRSFNSDFQIRHPSVSGAHCEIIAADGTFTVKDLGSTNGTLLDGNPVQESPWSRGQVLRLGDVEIVFAPAGASLPIRVSLPLRAVQPSKPALAAAPETAPVNVPLPPPIPGAPPAPLPAPIRLAAKPAARPAQNFFASIPGAFVFPLGRNGLILLLAGAVFFVIVRFLSGLLMFIGAGAAIACAGYIYSFLKSIITTTATGVDDMPDWPDYDGWLDSGLFPLFEFLAILLVCLGPYWLYENFARNPQPLLSLALQAAGLAYLPMALLAVAIYDNAMALNPLLIVPSILRVPLEYGAACLVLGLLALGASSSLSWLRDTLEVPLLAPVVAEFILLYTMAVVTRLVGLLYRAKQDRLRWKL
jgi:hypothetical protein